MSRDDYDEGGGGDDDSNGVSSPISLALPRSCRAVKIMLAAQAQQLRAEVPAVLYLVIFVLLVLLVFYLRNSTHNE